MSQHRLDDECFERKARAALIPETMANSVESCLHVYLPCLRADRQQLRMWLVVGLGEL